MPSVPLLRDLWQITLVSLSLSLLDYGKEVTGALRHRALEPSTSENPGNGRPAAASLTARGLVHAVPSPGMLFPDLPSLPQVLA